VSDFVSRNPVGNEIVLPSLIYCSAVGIKETEAASLLSRVYPTFNDFLNLEISNLNENARPVIHL